MRYQDSIDIDAPPDAVWQVLADVATWPRWTSTMTAVRVPDAGPLRPGLRATVEQPRLRPAVWQVTEVQPGRSFLWVSRAPGVVTAADHVITTNGTGSTVTQTLDQSGPLEPLIRLLYGGMTRRYLRTEVEGLKRFCEANRARRRD